MARSWTPSQEAAMSLRGKTLLVSAAAGSGKTSVLTERIIRTLTDKEHPADLSRLLVVTFTRAAAAELKSRIAEALTAALAADPSNRRLSTQLMQLGSAQISTIDSFFGRIVRANFEQLGLPATFRIADESEILPLCIETMDGVIEEFYERYAPRDGNETFSQIFGNSFAEALDHLLSNRSDGKLTLKLLDYLEGFSSYPEGIGLLQESANALREDSEKDFLQTRYGNTVGAYLTDLFDAYSKDLSEHRNALESDPDAFIKCDPLISYDISFCAAMQKALAERDYERVRTVALSFLPGRFPTIRNKSNAVSAYQEWRTGFRKTIAEKVQTKLRFSTDEIALQSSTTAELCEMLYRLYATYEERIMAEKNQRGILEHNDVRALLCKLLTNADGSPTELAASLSAQYDAVYIDEYQDVDLIQDRIFSLVGGNRRFMVGDIKQSIYGFRGSDPSIFSAYRRAFPLYTQPEAEGADGICVFMSDNFRCNRPVIEFANQICSFLFSACETSVGYRPQDDLVCSKRPPEQASEGYPHPVQAVFFDAKTTNQDGEDEDSRGGEAAWVATEISRLLRNEVLDNGEPISPSDVAILVRTHAQGAAYVRELEALGIPVSSESSADFLRDPHLTDTLNLLRAVDNPYRDLPLSELLVSPIGGFSLEEVSMIREASNDAGGLYDAMLACQSTETPNDLSEKCAETLSWLEALRDSASVLPADRFLRLLYLDERMVSHADTPILLFLYDQARLYQRSSFCGLYGFLNHMERLLENGKVSAGGFAKAESAVTVMTVHHSKGLEFPVVFLSSCGAGFTRSDSYESLLFHRNVGCAAKLFDRELAEHETTALCEAVKLEIDAELTEESIRTLYVALTRARERLYVTGTVRGKWENAISAARSVHRGNRAAILGCNSYLAWILAALQEKEAQNPEFPCIFQHISADEMNFGESAATTKTTVESSVIPSPAPKVDPVAERYARILKNTARDDYPLAALQGLPTKVAASKLEPDLLDQLTDPEQDIDALQAQIALMQSATPQFDALLRAHDNPSATDIGTATHAFLEFCDFERLRSDGIDAECERLLSMRFLSPDAVRIVHREQLEKFRTCNLMEWIVNAKKLRREQKFGMSLPLASLTSNRSLKDRMGEHTIFVQGSIDLLLEMPDGELWLVDYKTDAIIPTERKAQSLFVERMQKAHGDQLYYYAKAVERLFGKPPAKSFIYSLPLGSAVEIEPTKE